MSACHLHIWTLLSLTYTAKIHHPALQQDDHFAKQSKGMGSRRMDGRTDSHALLRPAQALDDIHHLYDPTSW